ncbi:hypothetical protein [Tahibacter sp.]|uniref:hypothetical protein n=1 Tax=Tahibacter sp. TaxID=2056211 RepID=UPI0028C43B39|nr:hypothetical protein [Tahibacter sp.]
MKRREALSRFAVLGATPLIGACSNDKSSSSIRPIYSIDLCIDSSPHDFANSEVSKIGSASLKESFDHIGLIALAAPLAVVLPGGFEVQVSCERIADGHFHFGLSHDGVLASMGKYFGSFAVRMFPPGHQAYIVEAKSVGPVHGF